MKLIVTGPRGKMGRLITQAAAEHSDIELIAGVGPFRKGLYRKGSGRCGHDRPAAGSVRSG